MKKNRIRKKVVLPCIGIGMMLALSACDATGQMTGNTSTGSAITASQATDSSVNGSTTTDIATTTENGKTSISVSGDNITIKGNGATSTGKTITISEAGSYQFSGSLEEGQIKIDTDGEVKLILDQFSITNSKDAPIINEKGTMQILLKENTENKVVDRRSAKEDTDSSTNNAGSKTDDSNTSADSTEFDAAIYSEGDLLLGGQGSLTVEGGYEDGIHSKSALTMESGTYEITASHHGLNGKKTLTVKDGTYGITTVEDALHSKGDVSVENGKLAIQAGDDALHADQTLTVKNGTIDIQKSNEGLEGITVNVEGGDISIQSSDDGINGAGESEDGSAVDISVNISGGKVRIVPGGDGIDSNGDLNVSGGTVVVDGPSDGGNAPIDYDGTATITGGTVFASGNSGMFQGFDENSSTQSSIIDYLDQNAKAGESITITDASGKEIFSSSDTTQSFNTFLYSSADLKEGQDYTVKVGSTSKSVTISKKTNTTGTRSQGMGQPPMGDGNGQPPMNGGNGQAPQNGSNKQGMGQPPMENNQHNGRKQKNNQGSPQNGMPPMGQGGQQDRAQQGMPPMGRGGQQDEAQQGMPPMGQGGQHSLQDTLFLLEEGEEHENCLLLGSRTQSGSSPLRSRLGNAITRKVFSLTTGVPIRDTQTGLRCFGKELIPDLLAIPGNRYEYEMNVLLEFARAGIPILEYPIETIYLNDNAGSHFDTVKDSFRIYGQILKFISTSLLSFLLDFLLYSLCFAYTGQIFLSNAIARILSLHANFFLNKNFVFAKRQVVHTEDFGGTHGKTHAPFRNYISYLGLALFLFLINSLLLSGIVNSLNVNAYFAKILTELALFRFSYYVQKNLIFNHKENEGRNHVTESPC